MHLFGGSPSFQILADRRGSYTKEALLIRGRALNNLIRGIKSACHLLGNARVHLRKDNSYTRNNFLHSRKEDK